MAAFFIFEAGTERIEVERVYFDAGHDPRPARHHALPDPRFGTLTRANRSGACRQNGRRVGFVYGVGIQLPWKPNGTRTGSWIVATGSPVKSWASRITTSERSVVAS